MTAIKTGTHTGSASTTVTLSNGSVYHSIYKDYGPPFIIDTIVYPDRIEIIYRCQSRVSNNWGSLPDQVYKIIYTISEKSEKIIGKIIPAQPETYLFTQPETC